MITIDLGSAIFTYVILIALTYFGWKQGFRYMLSIALFTTIAYLLTVRGGDTIVNTINRIYSNGPRVAAFASGRDPTAVAPLPPLIPDNLQAPLLLRFLVFLGIVIIGIAYTFPWEAQLQQAKVKPVHPLRILGALTGLYTAILLISAANIFWTESAGTVNVPSLAATALNGLPDYSSVIPSVIVAFFILLIIVILLRLTRIWWIDKAADKDIFIIR